MLQSLAACCLGLGSLTGGDAVGGRGAPGLVLEGHHGDGVLLTRLQPRLVEGGDGAGELGDHTALVVLPGDGVRKSIENEKWVKTHTHTKLFKDEYRRVPHIQSYTPHTDMSHHGDVEPGVKSPTKCEAPKILG